jgi:DNA-binding protein H-NS
MPTLEQIQAKMKKLLAQEESLIAKRAHSVLNEIRDLMEKYHLTTADIDSHSSAKRKPGRRAGGGSLSATMRKKVAKSASFAAKGKLPAKYLNPKTGETWSGHARPPQWIKAVKDRSVFLIDGSGTPARNAPAKPAGKRAAAKKTAARKVGVKKTAAKTRAVKKTAAKRAAVVEKATPTV